MGEDNIWDEKKRKKEKVNQAGVVAVVVHSTVCFAAL